MEFEDDLPLVSKETAILAKEKGFNWMCWYSYLDDEQTYLHCSPKCNERIIYDFKNKHVFDGCKKCPVSAPTLNFMNIWLREKHKINIVIFPSYKLGTKTLVYSWIIFDHPELDGISMEFDSYDETMEDGIKNALNLI